MKKLPTSKKIALVLIMAMAVSHPVTGQYVLQALDWGFSQIFIYGAWVSVVTAAYLIALGAWEYFKSEQPHIPSKAKPQKVKGSEYLA